MLLLTAALLLLHVWSAQGQTATTSSSSTFTFSPASSSSSSSSFYTGNEPSYPGCYLCPAITQCPTFPNTTVHPAFSIVATQSAAVDEASCTAITGDILTEVTQYAATNSCIEAIGYLACYGSLYQQLDCHHPISPEWPALCANFTSCLEPAGRAFIDESGLCTNISAFLNRPVSIQPAGSSSSSGALVVGSSGGVVATGGSSGVSVVSSSSGGGGGGGNTVGSGASTTHYVSAVLAALVVAMSCALMA